MCALTILGVWAIIETQGDACRKQAPPRGETPTVATTYKLLVQLCANNDSILDCQGNTFIRPPKRLCCNVILLYKAQYTVFKFDNRRITFSFQ